MRRAVDRCAGRGHGGPEPDRARLRARAPTGGVRAWTVGSHLQVAVTIAGRQRPAPLFAGRPAGREPGPRRLPHRGQAGPARPRRFALRCGLAAGRPGFDQRAPTTISSCPRAPPHTLLVAGGIGITPMLGMALTLAARGASLRMAYAARDEGELVFADALRAALGDRLADLRRAHAASASISTPRSPRLPAQRAAADLRAGAAAAGRAGGLGAGRPAAGRPALRDLRLQRQPAGRARSGSASPRHDLAVRGAGRSHRCSRCWRSTGSKSLSDCQRGECGLCAIDVLELHGTIDHRDVFFSAAEKRENRRLCAACRAPAEAVSSSTRPGAPTTRPEHAGSA